jgi:hypothetical protein
MYVCMYVCMYGWMYGCMDVWMDGWMYGWMYVCICLCLPVCLAVCVSVSVCLSVCLSVRPSVRPSVCRLHVRLSVYSLCFAPSLFLRCLSCLTRLSTGVPRRQSVGFVDQLGLPRDDRFEDVAGIAADDPELWYTHRAGCV